MNSWIAPIRSLYPFQTLKNGSGSSDDQILSPDLKSISLGVALSDDWSMLRRTPVTKIYSGSPVTHADGFPGYINLYNATTIGPTSNPSAPEPAAAQTADRMVMVWSEHKEINTHVDQNDKTRAPFLSTNCINARKYTEDQNIPVVSGDLIVPQRDNNNPAVFIVRGFRKYYSDGLLHRKGNHPALIADEVKAIWYRDGVPDRFNGPASITLKNYREYYRHGEFRGFRYDGVDIKWGPLIDERNLVNLKGPTSPLSLVYFDDPQDELEFMSLYKKSPVL